MSSLIYDTLPCTQTTLKECDIIPEEYKMNFIFTVGGEGNFVNKYSTVHDHGRNNFICNVENQTHYTWWWCLFMCIGSFSMLCLLLQLKWGGISFQISAWEQVCLPTITVIYVNFNYNFIKNFS